VLTDGSSSITSARAFRLGKPRNVLDCSRAIIGTTASGIGGTIGSNCFIMRLPRC